MILKSPGEGTQCGGQIYFAHVYTEGHLNRLFTDECGVMGVVRRR